MSQAAARLRMPVQQSPEEQNFRVAIRQIAERLSNSKSNEPSWSYTFDATKLMVAACRKASSVHRNWSKPATIIDNGDVRGLPSALLRVVDSHDKQAESLAYDAHKESLVGLFVTEGVEYNLAALLVAQIMVTTSE